MKVPYVPAMLISHSKKFIFIHNYKVAGTSIESALCDYSNPSFTSSSIKDKLLLISKIYPEVYSGNFSRHISAPELKSLAPEKLFENYFKFGFVRDPWDWQVSLYTYMLKEVGHHQHKLAKSFKGFDDYIEWRVNEDLRLQKDFFYDKSGKCLMDFIGKFETIESDMAYIFNKFAMPARLQHLNKSRNTKDYLHLYSARSLKIVEEAFKEDIIAFGYQSPL